MMSPTQTIPAAWANTPTLTAWENRTMPLVPETLRSQRSKAILIALLVVTLAVLSLIVPPHDVVIHNVLHHLNILPFMLAGMFFGWRGAVKTILFACVLQVPLIYRHWSRAPVDAQDQIVELSTFGAAGIIAGVLADRERMQRRRMEETKSELERVYTELRQNIDQLKKAERLTAAGQLSASLAHEIRNPLASISGATGIIVRGQASPEVNAECLDILSKESQRLNKLLTNFLEFARPRLPRLQTVVPAELIHSVGTLAQHAASARNISIELQPVEQTCEIQCDPEQIKQLLLNLILNAIQASDSHGTVMVRNVLAKDCFMVEVCDVGSGISPEVRDHIFEPFYTTRDTGTGLGLAIALNIAEQHGGTLFCLPNATRGTTFRMVLPAVPSKAAATLARRSAHEA